jgi:hypothetical protein
MKNPCRMAGVVVVQKAAILKLKPEKNICSSEESGEYASGFSD